MDVHARRKLWDVLHKYKAGKVILVASHFLDEIDLYADRKAILSRGHVRCCGTSMFIKSRFGLGYLLTVDFDEDVDAVTRGAEESVLSFIRRYVPNATLDSVSRTFRLPQESSSSFASLFSDLDQQKQTLGIRFFSVSMTSLEDVFLRVEHEALEEESGPGMPLESHQVPVASYSPPTQLAQFRALTYYRLRDILRHPSLYANVVGMAVLQQVIGLVIGTVNPGYPGSGGQFQAVSLSDPTLISSAPVPVAFRSDSNWSGNVTSLFAFPWLHVGDPDGYGALVDTYANSSVSGFISVNGSSVASSTSINLLVKPTYLHALPMYWSQIVGSSLAALTSATLGQAVQQGPALNITMQPLPSPVIPINGNALGSVILLSLSLAILPFTLSVEIVREKKLGIRHQLLVMGLNPFVYWIATLVRDLLIYSILGLSTVILILAFQIPCLNGPALFPLILCLGRVPANVADLCVLDHFLGIDPGGLHESYSRSCLVSRGPAHPSYDACTDWQWIAFHNAALRVSSGGPSLWIRWNYFIHL